MLRASSSSWALMSNQWMSAQSSLRSEWCFVMNFNKGSNLLVVNADFVCFSFYHPAASRPLMRPYRKSMLTCLHHSHWRNSTTTLGIPHRLEPKPQRFPRTLEDRPRGRRRLTLASRTSLLAPGRHPRLGSPAGRTPKPGRPTDTPKKIRTGGLRSEPVVKFHKRARVIDPANGMGSILGHHNILPLRERIGYPIYDVRGRSMLP